MKWISTEGGPLILLTKRNLLAWGGCTGEEGKTDYDRACSVMDYVGIIPVGKGEGLVFGDEPLQTAWIPSSEREGIIVRWRYAENEASLLNHAKNVPSNAFECAGLFFNADDPMLYLFDSAIPGQELHHEEAQLIRLVPGIYLIETASYQPDEHTALVIHRLIQA